MAPKLVERLRASSASAMYGKLFREAADRIDELEIRCSDKDAGTAQLVEQLQKAEAQNAAVWPACPHQNTPSAQSAGLPRESPSD